MVEQQRDAEREQLFATFSSNKKIAGPEFQRLAYEAAKEYIKRFGAENDHNVREVQRFIGSYEKAWRGNDVFAAYTAKDYTKAFELGRPLLQTESDNFFVLATLVEAGYANALAGKASLNSETVGYAKRAIALLDAGKVTQADPMKNVEVAQGFLNYALGWLVKDEDPVEAATAFRKAVQFNSPYREDPLTYRWLGGTILKGEFTQLSTQYNEKFGNKPQSPEQNAMLEKINRVADRAIDAYARAVALSTKPEQQEARAKMLAQLTALYKNFHNNSEEGLEQLIANVLSKPVP
jgi:hypothetical protein